MDEHQDKIGIKTWAQEDRPREKMLLNGRRHLTDAELIAILIGSGNKLETAVDLSKRILSFYQNDVNKLSQVSIQDLMKFKGIGEAKAISIVAALELGRRRKDTEPAKRMKITSAKDAFDDLISVFMDLNHEEFWILMLNRNNLVLGKQLIGRGGLTGTVADPKIIFKIAIENNAAHLILAHNHPSGNLKPSEEDIRLTKKVVESGKMLDLPILDHLIITDRNYFSFADEGLI